MTNTTSEAEHITSTTTNGKTTAPGFFGRMRKSVGKKKKTTTNVNHNHGRRVVKGTTPPSSDDTTPQSELIIGVSDNSEDAQPEKDHASTGNLPSVQTEALREKTEQWRKERIDATAAIRKENKEKEVMEHRRKAGGGGGVVSDNGADSKSAAGSEPVPAILTVQSKFPEHKRKAASDDHAGKKIRVSKSSDNPAVVKKESADTWREKIPEWVKIIAPAAAVAATAAIIAMRMFRKR